MGKQAVLLGIWMVLLINMVGHTNAKPIPTIHVTSVTILATDTDSIKNNIIDKVAHLPEVVELQQQLKMAGDTDNHVFINVLDTTEFKDYISNYKNYLYHVQVGIDTKERNIIRYNFYIKLNLAIYGYDPVNDTILPLKTWRKTNNYVKDPK